jgi:BirA family biotin operon repressor/biotin-[acetyl-CoA-carboxylase] ligase
MWLNLSTVYDCLTTESFGRRVIYVTSTHSTMDVARREAEDGAPEGTVVIAEEQTAGRGRFGRPWVSPAGLNLYFTLILRPDIARLRYLSIATPLAVCLAVDAASVIRPMIKWPNDVIVGGKKLAGTLIESEMSGDEVRYALVGIGVNVNYRVDDPSIAAIATSLLNEAATPVSREDLFAGLLNQFEDLYGRLKRSRGDVLDWWRARLDTIGRQVDVTFRGDTYSGVVKGVDAEGNLLLTRPDGDVMTLEAGEVSLQGYARD